MRFAWWLWLVAVIALNAVPLVLAVHQTACVDVDLPLPVDGQLYVCVATDVETGAVLGTVGRCGSWNDGEAVSRAVGREFLAERGDVDNVHAECRGTGKVCAR